MTRRSWATLGGPLIILAGIFVSCAPSDPAGTDIGTHTESGRLQIAIPVCPGEVVTKVSAFSASGSGDASAWLWSVVGEVDGDDTGVVIVTLGEQGDFSRTVVPPSALAGREFTFAFESNIHSEEFVLEESDFPEIRSGRWITSHGSVKTSQLEATRCR